MTVKTDILKITQLKQRFAETSSISVGELVEFYGSLPEATFYHHIRKLISAGILQRVGKGLYKLDNKSVFYPEISGRSKSIYNKIRKDFPFTKACIWNTDCLNEFTKHQPGKHNQLIEVEKDASESIFYFIKEHYRDVFFNPTEEVYHKYISGQKQSIIILNLISEAPVQKVDAFIVPTIEKIMVDLFADKVVFSPYQGHEMSNIFSEAIEKYTINWTALYRYAGRRNKRNEIELYIKKLNLWQ